MKTYIYTMVTTALMIYILSAVLNQYGYAWTDWGVVVNGFWNFALVFGTFHLYRHSRHTFFVIDWIWIAAIGFSAIDLFHVCHVLFIWISTGQTINQILIASFEHYNPFFCCFAILVSGGAGFIYLINYPSIRNK